MTAPIAVRLIRDDDVDRLRRMFYRLSPESVYRRFFTLYTVPPEHALRALAVLDHDRRDAVVADVDGEIVGVARYAALAGATRTAELAVVVEDAWQRGGLGRRLTECAVALARLHGMTALTATVQSDNRAAVALLRSTFPRAAWSMAGSTYDVTVDLSTNAERMPA